MARALLVVALLWGVGASEVLAQADFAGLKLKPGDLVYVTDSSGAEVSGRVTSLSPLLLAISSYSFKPEPGLRIERRGDPLWDGAAIGAGIGLGLGAVLSTGECGVDWPAWKCTVAGGMWGALLGTLIDVRHEGRTKVFIGTAAPPGGRSARLSHAPVRPPLSVRIRFDF